MASPRITKTIVDGANPGPADYFIWDSELKGFGLKVSNGGRKTYVCQYGPLEAGPAFQGG